MKIAGLDLSISSSGIVIEELDNNLDIVDVKCYGFTQRKKYSMDNIILYDTKDFSHKYARYLFVVQHILEWCKDVDYVAIEDYAYGASGSIGMVFDLAEFEGFVKLNLFNEGKAMRFYPINTIKKFFTGYGLSDKISMYQAFVKYKFTKPDISYLPIVDNGHGVATTSDIVDAYAICELLRQELRFKQKMDDLKACPKFLNEIFTKKTDKNPSSYMKMGFVKK
ncbi:MAG: hypothetical protein MJZ34_11175 [Paludibacteraceae bacterium]|nr:hypothetical protein [Paludibacteraceae bacterium]